MRRLIVSMNVTLNGMMAGPYGELDWHVPYWDDEMSRAAAKQLGNADTLLFGRITYQSMAPFWQAQQNSSTSREDIDYAQMMNSYEKIVFSKSLARIGGWNNSRLAARSLNKEIRELKRSPGKDILVYGSGKLVAALMRNSLVDEFRLWIYPVALKKGLPLFNGLRDKLQLKPVKMEVFESGVVLMGYERLK